MFIRNNDTRHTRTTSALSRLTASYGLLFVMPDDTLLKSKPKFLLADTVADNAAKVCQCSARRRIRIVISVFDLVVFYFPFPIRFGESEIL
jgi:hypothetical protein